MAKINKVLEEVKEMKKLSLLVLIGSACSFMLFVFSFSSICSAASYPRSTTTPLATDLSMNQYKLNDVGDIISKGPWADVRAYASFSAAIDAIGASNKTLLIPNTQTVSASKTVPTNVHLLFLKGGSLDIGAGVTVTINGPLDAPLAQIFSGNGSVSFGAGAVKEVYPQWWGAVGDGSTNDRTAIKNAIVASPTGGIVKFILPAIAYAISSGLYLTDTGESGGTPKLVHLIGNKAHISNQNHVVIKYTGSADDTAIMLTARGLQGWRFSGIELDANDLAGICMLHDTYSTANMQYGIIEDSVFRNFRKEGMRINASDAGRENALTTISKCGFYTSANVAPDYQIHFGQLGSNIAAWTIENCRFEVNTQSPKNHIYVQAGGLHRFINNTSGGCTLTTTTYDGFAILLNAGSLYIENWHSEDTAFFAGLYNGGSNQPTTLINCWHAADNGRDITGTGILVSAYANLHTTSKLIVLGGLYGRNFGVSVSMNTGNIYSQGVMFGYYGGNYGWALLAADLSGGVADSYLAFGNANTEEIYAIYTNVASGNTDYLYLHHMARTHMITLAGNILTSVEQATELQTGSIHTFYIKQDATGSRTIVWGTKFKFVGGSAPTLTGAANSVDILTFMWDGTYFRETGRNMDVR